MINWYQSAIMINIGIFSQRGTPHLSIQSLKTSSCIREIVNDLFYILFKNVWCWKKENYRYNENENYGYNEICTYLHLIRFDRISLKLQYICAIKSFKLNHIFKNLRYKYIILILI